MKLPVKKKVKKNKRLYWDDEAIPATFSTGCSVLDCALGGGWARRQIVSVEGDNSSGKTLLAIEACANFLASVKGKKRIIYCDAEAAFDLDYAGSLGLDVGRIDFVDSVDTVEDLYESVEKAIADSSKSGVETLYVLDSLDALSDREEMKRKIDEGTYGANKAKLLSQTFRRLVRGMKKGRVTLFVVNQIREKLNVTFGKKTTTAGGKALGFYAYQRLELNKIKRLKKTRKKVDRAVGILVKAHVSKNKMAPPHREVEFPLMFNYGVEDVVASIEWLKKVHRIEEAFDSKAEADKFVRALDNLSVEEYLEERDGFAELVKEIWADIESDFAVERRKY